MSRINNTTKKLVFSAMAIALATVTSFIKLFTLPMGGTITLFSMFFICLIGYWYGPKIGIAAGIAYGLLQFVVDPFIFSFPQVLIDYPLAFGALGLSGFFRNKTYGIQLGFIVGVFGRFAFSALSGILFFASYAPKGTNPIIYSILYNASYLGSEGVITLILLAFPPITKALSDIKSITS